MYININSMKDTKFITLIIVLSLIAFLEILILSTQVSIVQQQKDVTELTNKVDSLVKQYEKYD